MEVKRKVISMGERDVIQEARTTITLLQTAFSKGFTPSPDTLQFQENLDQMLKGLRKARRVDNRLLIELEKFYHIDWSGWVSFERRGLSSLANL